MENVKKEIEYALENFTDKDLLVKYLMLIVHQQYIQGEIDYIDKYILKLKQYGK